VVDLCVDELNDWKIEGINVQNFRLNIEIYEPDWHTFCITCEWSISEVLCKLYFVHSS